MEVQDVKNRYVQEKKMISVIIPVYNRENTIEKSIKSVLNQTYHKLEIIIVDDGSNDNTFSVIKKIKDSRIRIFSYRQNRGACYARNIGIKNARGEYIAFQDSDDKWYVDKLKRQVDFIEKTNSDFVFCGMNRIDDIQNMRFYYPKRKLKRGKDIHKQLLYENMISTQTMLMKRKVCEKIKFDEKIKKFQDWDYVIRVSKLFKIEYLNEALVDSFVQVDSISVNVSNYNALRVIYNKYKQEIQEDRRIYARYLYLAGKYLESHDHEKAKKLYICSLKTKISCKALIKYLLIS